MHVRSLAFAFALVAVLVACGGKQAPELPAPQEAPASTAAAPPQGPNADSAAAAERERAERERRERDREPHCPARSDRNGPTYRQAQPTLLEPTGRPGRCEIDSLRVRRYYRSARACRRAPECEMNRDGRLCEL